MTLYYNGVDITDAVEIVEATNTDACGGRCDCLDIAFAKPSHWYAWQPNTDDVIRLEHNGYDTGDMYVSAFFPEAGLFKITAFSIPQKARTRRWQAFRNMKLKDIVYACASECGMSYGLYGIDGNIRYPFILRRNEGAAAFLSRLCAYEGAVLKCVNGKIAVIGIEYAQKRDAIRGWELTSDTDGVTYTRRSDNRVRCMIVRSPDGDAKALDVNAEKGIERIANAPASCAADAGRWARGLLLSNNRKAETLTVDSVLDTGITAMQRIDVDSSTDMSGSWTVDEVTHDFMGGTTSVTLCRSVTL